MFTCGSPLLSSSLFFLFFVFITAVSSDNVFNINSVDDFINFTSNVNKGSSFNGTTVYLTNDIDFNSYSSVFEPAGKNSNAYFSGTFDGQGHTIKNLVVNSSSFIYAALFGFSKGLSIKNIVVDKTCTFSSYYKFPSSSFVSSIVGDCEGGICIIENVVNMADISYHGVKTMNYVITGGIAAKCYGNCVLSNCVNLGSIMTSSSNSSSFVFSGGIAGEIYVSKAWGSIKSCINYGITANNIEVTSYAFIGGISGIIWSNTTIENCLSTGPLSSAKALNYTYVGSVIGGTKPKSQYNVIMNNTISNSFWTESVGNYNASGEFIDNETILNIAGTESIEMNESLFNVINSIIPGSSSDLVIAHLNGGRIGNSSYDNLILNKAVNGISEPVKYNSTFKLWCTDTECSATCDSNTMDKCDSKELYAAWDRANVAFLTFDDNNKVINKTFSFGDVIEYPEGVKKTGYRLIGWDNTTATAPGFDIVVSAIWNINNYTVIFDFGNGTEAEKRAFEYNTEVIYPENPTKEGHSFIDWNDTTITTMPAHNLTIKALWIPNNYTVTFNTTGGTAPSPLKREITYGEQYGELPETTRTGYTLAGWFTEEDGNGDNIDFDSNVTIPNNHTLYVYWIPNKYTITFDFDNGTEAEERTFTYNAEVIYPVNPTKEGYKFINWNDTSIKIMPAYNLSITARWGINNYTVIFDFDNGIDPETRSFTFNTDIIYPEDPTKEGYIFFGWGNNITIMPAHNLTITAKWVNVTSQSSFVEIVFNVVDLSNETIKEIINKYTDSGFEIIEISRNSESEIVMIVKFYGAEEASDFVRNVSTSRDKDKCISRVGFTDNKMDISYSYVVPLLTGFLLLI